MKFVPTKVKMIMPSVDAQKVRNFSVLFFLSSRKIGNAGKERYFSVFVAFWNSSQLILFFSIDSNLLMCWIEFLVTEIKNKIKICFLHDLKYLQKYVKKTEYLYQNIYFLFTKIIFVMLLTQSLHFFKFVPLLIHPVVVDGCDLIFDLSFRSLFHLCCCCYRFVVLGRGVSCCCVVLSRLSGKSLSGWDQKLVSCCCWCFVVIVWWVSCCCCVFFQLSGHVVLQLNGWDQNLDLCCCWCCFVVLQLSGLVVLQLSGKCVGWKWEVEFEICNKNTYFYMRLIFSYLSILSDSDVIFYLLFCLSTH